MTARENILKKLRTSLEGTTPRPDDFNVELVTKPWSYGDTQGKIKQLRTMMESVRTEVYQTTKASWVTLFADLLKQKKVNNLLYAPTTEWGKQIADYWQLNADLPTLKLYDQLLEKWKTQLFFEIESSITSTLGGIAATGSLIVWPNSEEPRLMSLVPPIHFAILEASKIVDNFYEAQQKLNWVEHTPTNALLISGPSKTADIEQVLAYGAHGPKELIVLILEDA
ncbi:LutC/YkgG family protein [Entomomonas asaccharolytica]|uniref:Lactate utilization protein n=1 Tax=Entomomonas asaccharolytica TaxID=2785331 RepID=A0A974NHG6_9GAMM|nr:lactate utilization protein [Entomomonas asaccharolytica]QQP86544.1 lactate utilization protein [Entomomonas asaccharolytica]